MNIEKYLEIARISNAKRIEENSGFGREQIGFIESLLKKISDNGYQKIAVYGTGLHTKKLLSFLQQNHFEMEKIKCIICNGEIDSTELDGFPVLSIEDAQDRFLIDAIIISSYKYENEIFERLQKQVASNVPIMRIYNCILGEASERLILNENMKVSDINCYGETYYQHINRYFFSLGYVHGKTVLDIACGSGYGSDILATKAKYVYGVDIDKEAINLAESSFKRDNITFLNESIETIQLKNKVDVIISFETIEHIKDESAYFEMIQRNLKKDGMLLTSTPVSEYDGQSRINRHHVNQYTINSFTKKTKEKFSEVLFFRQNPNTQGAIMIDDGNMKDAFPDETYMIAVCFGLL